VNHNKFTRSCFFLFKLIEKGTSASKVNVIIVLEVIAAGSHACGGDFVGNFVVTGRHLDIMGHHLAHLTLVVVSFKSSGGLVLLFYDSFHAGGLVSFSGILTLQLNREFFEIFVQVLFIFYTSPSYNFLFHLVVVQLPVFLVQKALSVVLPVELAKILAVMPCLLRGLAGLLVLLVHGVRFFMVGLRDRAFVVEHLLFVGQRRLHALFMLEELAVVGDGSVDTGLLLHKVAVVGFGTVDTFLVIENGVFLICKL
jgi:hypothetical protein